MNRDVKLSEKIMHSFLGVQLLVNLFCPTFILKISYLVPISILLIIELIIWTINMNTRQDDFYYNLIFNIFLLAYCAIMWLFVWYQINPEWLLACLLFLLVIIYVLVSVKKEIRVHNMQMLIEVATCFILTYVRLQG